MFYIFFFFTDLSVATSNLRDIHTLKNAREKKKRDRRKRKTLLYIVSSVVVYYFWIWWWQREYIHIYVCIYILYNIDKYHTILIVIIRARCRFFSLTSSIGTSRCICIQHERATMRQLWRMKQCSSNIARRAAGYVAATMRRAYRFSCDKKPTF